MPSKEENNLTRTVQQTEQATARQGLIGRVLVGVVRLIAYFNTRTAQSLHSRLPQHWRNFIATVNYDGIKLKVNTGETVGRKMYYFHDFEREQRNALVFLMSRDAVFYDVGANIGYYSVLAAKHGMKAYAFEPFPKLCRFIKFNAELNGLQERVAIVSEALSDKVGATTFYPPRAGNWGVGKIFAYGDTNSAKQSSGGDPIEVKTLTLDDAVKRYGKPDLIKIDIEGAEYLLLRNKPSVLSAADAPILFIEFHPGEIEALGGSVAAITEVLSEAGYKEYVVKQSQSTSHEWRIFATKPLGAEFVRRTVQSVA